MGSFVVLAITCLIAGWFACGLVLAFFLIGLRELNASTHAQRASFIVIGTILFSPSLIPAGTLAALPVPFGVMLAFVRSLHDIEFFVRIWWFLLPSFLLTAAALWLVARFLFPNHSLKPTAAG